VGVVRLSIIIAALGNWCETSADELKHLVRLGVSPVYESVDDYARVVEQRTIIFELRHLL